MGLYKRCTHADQNACKDPWWGQFMHARQNHRIDLNDWTKVELKNRTEADIAFQRMRDEIRKGIFSPNGPRTTADSKADAAPAVTFGAVMDTYVKRHVSKARGKGTADRCRIIRAYFGDTPIAAISTADVEDWVEDLEEPALLTKFDKVKRVRTVSTINRYKALLRHLFSWAMDRNILDTSPFYKGQRAIVSLKLADEDNKRHRRLSAADEAALILASSAHLTPLIICGLDSGLRRSELRRLEWRDLDDRDGWILVRGVDDQGKPLSKSGRSRWVPATDRFTETVAALRTDANDQPKGPRVPVFSYGDGTPVGDWRTAFELSCARAHIVDLRWHDLRHEFASRLVDAGAPLPHVQELLGHADIDTTMRYVSVTRDELAATVKAAETRRKSRAAR